MITIEQLTKARESLKLQKGVAFLHGMTHGEAQEIIDEYDTRNIERITPRFSNRHHMLDGLLKKEDHLVDEEWSQRTLADKISMVNSMILLEKFTNLEEAIKIVDFCAKII